MLNDTIHTIRHLFVAIYNKPTLNSGINTCILRAAKIVFNDKMKTHTRSTSGMHGIYKPSKIRTYCPIELLYSTKNLQYVMIISGRSTISRNVRLALDTIHKHSLAKASYYSGVISKYLAIDRVRWREFSTTLSCSPTR